MKMRHRVPLIVLVCATLLSSQPARAQFSQQGPKLMGTGAVEGAYGARQGYSVSLSADGNTAIIGGYNDNSSIGAAWVWTRSGGVWNQQGTRLVGSDAVGPAEQGYSVSLSADGNTAIVGGPGDNYNATIGGEAGAAWVWTRSGGVWTQQGPKLVGTGAGGSAFQGWSVSLSADGNTAIVGGYMDNGQAGAAWIWTRSGGVWIQQGTKLVGSDAVYHSYQGYSVSLSADGNTAIIGGDCSAYSSTGAAWVWTRSAGAWTQQGPKLVGSGGHGGGSVSLSADGNTAIVGGRSDNSQSGATWVWTRSGGVWIQQGNKLVGSGAVGKAQQGCSVSLSADGNTVVVGGWSDNTNVGAAWVFTAPAPTVPVITTQPVSVFRQTGENATFSVTANGQPPLRYQWHNGTGILANATNSSLTITNAQADASYYVVVSNPYGSATSQSAQLKILVNYTTAIPPVVSPTPPPLPPKLPGQDKLVIVTHGWQRDQSSSLNTDAPQWVYDMTDFIGIKLPDSSWTVFALGWNGKSGAGQVNVNDAASRGDAIGQKYGVRLSAQGWSHVHFIGHSAGAVLIQAAAETLKANSFSPVVVHTTFLDPYNWTPLYGHLRFGAGSDWSDNYFEFDLSGVLSLTGGQMDHSYNVDISALDPHWLGNPVGQHAWAYEFYQKTVIGGVLGGLGNTSEGRGFPLSKEGGNWDYAINFYHVNNSPYPLGAPAIQIIGNSSSVPIQHYTYLGIFGETSLSSPLKNSKYFVT